MPKVSEVFSSGFLKAEHLNGQPYTIDGWAKEIVYGTDAYVLYLAGEARKLRLSNMCAHDIAKALGIDDMENWVGGKIELYPHEQKITDRDTQLEKTVTMIRARAPAGISPTATLVGRPTPPRKPDPDDEMPF